MKNPRIVTLLASAVRAATTVTTVADLAKLMHTDSGAPLGVRTLIAYLNITGVPTTDTVLLKLQEQEPVSGDWSDVPGCATSARATTGLVKLTMGEAIAAITATTAAVAVNQPVPPIFRLSIVHSTTTNFTYSLAVAVGD